VRRALALALALLSVAVSCGASVPSVVRDEMAKAPPGTATIIFFTDFECPFCRRTHAALAPVLAARRGHVRLVLRHVPLRQHPWARDAARAAICVGSEAYADALFASPDLSPAACEDLAVQHGVDRDALRRCTSAAETDARLARDLAAFDAVGGDGVPLLFIGATRLEGAQPPSTLERAVDEAIALAEQRRVARRSE
jgi:protein-disulfide isomerase